MPLLDVHGQVLNVIDRGAGEPVVFLHAFPLQAAMWDYQLDALDANDHVVEAVRMQLDSVTSALACPPCTP